MITLWLSLAGYILVERTALLKAARTGLKERIGGESSIGDIDISFFRHFPGISLHVSRVTLRDSLWQQHHHDLLNAEHVYLSFAVFRSILTAKVQLGKVYLEHGSVYLYTDTSGYSNTAALRSRQQSGIDKDTHPPDLALSDIRLVIEKQDKSRIVDLEIRRLNGEIDKKGRFLHIGVDAEIGVKNLVLNREKGSYLRDRIITGKLNLTFHTGSKILQCNKATLQTGGHTFRLTGRFFPDVSPDPYSLSIETKNIPYKEATALLTPALQEKLDVYGVDRPVNVSALIDAGSAEDPQPLINVRMDVHDNNVNTPIGRFNEVSFRGFFTNEWIHGQARQDENSAIRLTAFSGNLENNLQNISLHSDTLIIADCRHPILTCELHTRVPLSRLNNLAGCRSLRFEKGNATANIRYKGPLSANDSAVAIPGSGGAALYGSLDIDSAAITYLPYHLQLTDCKGRLRFDDKDLRVERLEARTAGSRFQVKGAARNIVSLLNNSPENVTMDWTITSPSLDLEDLRPLAGNPVEPAPAFGAIHLRLEAADLLYKNFKGTHATADLLFTGNAIKLDRLQLEQGGGSISLSGNLVRRPGTANPLTFMGHLEQVDLPGIFTAFDNFGQDAIRDKNLKGRLTADFRMNGLLTDKAGMVDKSLGGTVGFSIEGGQLVDFEPMEKIRETVSRTGSDDGRTSAGGSVVRSGGVPGSSANTSRFAESKNQLDLDTGAIRIHRMEIRPPDFTLFAEGTYEPNTGTNFSLLVPPGKAGSSLRLHAKTGDDGRLTISREPTGREPKATRPKAPSGPRPKTPSPPKKTTRKARH